METHKISSKAKAFKRRGEGRHRRTTPMKVKVTHLISYLSTFMMIKSFLICCRAYAPSPGNHQHRHLRVHCQGRTRNRVQSSSTFQSFRNHGSALSGLSSRGTKASLTAPSRQTGSSLNMFGWHRRQMSEFPSTRTMHTTKHDNVRTINHFPLKSATIDGDTEIEEEIHEEEWEDDVEEDDGMATTTSYDIILDGLNEAQVEAVTQPLESITRVVAGPGAGKTRVLTCRIAYLLKRDDEDKKGRTNSRILAVTFTKKAASEMQHRLESLLQDDEEYQNKLLSSSSPSDQELNSHDQGDEIYEEVVRHDGSNGGVSSASMIRRVSLGTFHSICAKILRWNGSELGALPSVRQYSPKDSDRGGDACVDGSFAIVDQTEQMRIIKQCLTDCGIDLKGSGRGQADIRPITILNAVGQLKSDDAMEAVSRPTAGGGDDTATGIKMTAKVRRVAEEVYPMYRKTLVSQNSLDFDDLILLTRELLKTNEDVRERMAKRWQHVLVDEFQDTSEVQLDLVRLLTTSSLMVVGDGDQSIYSWRGAHAESMSDFVQKFDKAGEKEVDTVYLMENYR